MKEMGDWWEHKLPFKHFQASNVLSPEEYDKVAKNFMTISELPNSKEGGYYKLTKTNANYDALMLGINEEISSRFTPLFSKEFIQLLCNFLSIPFLPRIDAGLHSNLRNSRTGWIHTDFCSAWFDESVTNGISDELKFPDRKRCEYFTGYSKETDTRPAEYIRAATLIYYLCNDNWQKGDGGETALYGGSTYTEFTNCQLVPPINNSILLFQCTPHSYHRFITNPGRVRNSIIIWLHSTVEFAQSCWGDAINRRKPL